MQIRGCKIVETEEVRRAQVFSLKGNGSVRFTYFVCAYKILWIIFLIKWKEGCFRVFYEANFKLLLLGVKKYFNM